MTHDNEKNLFTFFYRRYFNTHKHYGKVNHLNYQLYLIFSLGGDLMPNAKYKMSETPINEYSLQMDLTITSLEPKDFGGYLCIAKNALGKAEGTIRLQGVLKYQTFTFYDITFFIV